MLTSLISKLNWFKSKNSISLDEAKEIIQTGGLKVFQNEEPILISGIKIYDSANTFLAISASQNVYEFTREDNKNQARYDSQKGVLTLFDVRGNRFQFQKVN